MQVVKETTLKDFEFWCGGASTSSYLTSEELDIVEGILEDMYPDGIYETDLNDFFWFECDTIAEWLGYESFEEIMEREDNE